MRRTKDQGLIVMQVAFIIIIKHFGGCVLQNMDQATNVMNNSQDLF
jgi:hypothetical protein